MSGAIAGSVLHVETRRLTTVHGPFEVYVYRNLATFGYALAVMRGDISGASPVLARVHSSCVTSEVFGSGDCDCVEQLDTALAAIAEAGRGVLFYLMQEGRGAGFTAKVRDRMIVQASGERLTTFEAYAQLGLAPDHRSYEEVAYIVKLLGIEAPLTLLTGNPDKVREIERSGIVIAGTVPFSYAASPLNAHYLRAKLPAATAVRGVAETPAAMLPEPVEYFDPFVPEGMPGLVCTASYLLPIAFPWAARPRVRGVSFAVHWFRLHAYFDLLANHEWAALCYDDGTEAPPLARVQMTSLFDRFPLTAGSVGTHHWHASVRAFVEHGRGCAVFRIAEHDGLESPAGDGGAAVARLLAHHLGGRRARPVFDGPGPTPCETALAGDLRAHGVTLDPPLWLSSRGDDAV